MRSLNNMLLIMAAAGLVGWYYANAVLTAITHQVAQVMWLF